MITNRNSFFNNKILKRLIKFVSMKEKILFKQLEIFLNIYQLNCLWFDELEPLTHAHFSRSLTT